MTDRLDYLTAAPDAYQAVLGLEEYIAEQSGLDKALMHQLKLRASQIDGYAFCVDMHLKEARLFGLSRTMDCPSQRLARGVDLFCP